MGAISVSWRTIIAVLITILQIQAVLSVKTTVLTGVEGESIHFRCEYPSWWRSDAKYLCHEDNECSSYLIKTSKHDEWEHKERFSLYDNATGGFFIIKLKGLSENDSGTYRCGADSSTHPDYISVIKLNVSQVTIMPSIPTDQTIETEFHMPLLMTAVMCVAAMLFVCLFTLCLLLVVKQRRSSQPQNKEVSSDYETVTSGIKTEPKCCCSCSAPDCTNLSALPPPPPDFCPNFLSKYRESVVSFNLSDYVDVDVPGHICPYQHLDLGQLEEHVYHSLHRNSDPQQEPAKEQINC